MEATPSSITINLDPTTLAAWFGAIVSFFLFLFEIFKYKNDKGKLRFRINYDMVFVGQTLSGDIKKAEPKILFWTIDLSNPGTKNVVFSQMFFDFVGTKKHAVITRDYYGPINKFTLQPGESHQFLIHHSLVNPKKVKRVMVLDAVGNIYKKRVRYK